MAVSLGKRKRTGPVRGHQEGSEDEDDLRARFQKAFEAKFRPLEHSHAKPQQAEEVESDEDEEDDDDIDENASETSDWSGFSDEGDDVHVVAHAVVNHSFPEVDRSQQRAYMSSKPPSSDLAPKVIQSRQKIADQDDSIETANLKNDLALQRLLKESHLLDPGSFSANSAPKGKGRLKALDMRLQDLGAKKSLSTQHKMPIAHRKGIQSKATEREHKRRTNAAENGVILEKARHVAKDMKRRERSVGGPTVGKFRGGTLKLSGKDLRDIQGPKKQAKGKKGRR